MAHAIRSLPRQVGELMAALLRTAKKARQPGADVFYAPPSQRPLPLPLALAKSVLQVLQVGLLRGRCIIWLANTRFSGIPLPHAAPDLRPGTLLSFKAIYALRKLGCPKGLVGPAHRRLCASSEAQLAAVPQAPAALPIDTLDGRTATDEDVARFFAEHIASCSPCIVRGLRDSSPAVEHWSLDWFLERYGETLVPISDTDQERAGQPLRTLRKPGTYLQNCDSIFAAHPELLEQLEIDRLVRLADPLVYVHPHLFLGQSGRGSPFHCAPIWNVFVQIEGRKAWTWVHPEHMVFMYPQLVPLLYGPVLSHVRDGTPEDLERCPLFAHCPRYEAVLEPGDLMLNPAWWWHSVRNLDERSCGVATRWVERVGVEGQICGSIRPALQSFLAWEAAMGMSLPLLTLLTATGFGVVKPDPGQLTFFEAATRYHRQPSSTYLL